MIQNKYKDLEINISFFWRVQEVALLGLRKFFYFFPFLGKVARFIGGQLNYFSNAEARIERSRKSLVGDRKDAHQFGSFYGYEDEVKELGVARQYQEELSRPEFSKLYSESPALYAHISKKVSALFDKDKAIRDFMNFGVSFAYVDSQLAKLYPQINFTGIDRSTFTKFYNEQVFRDIPNLKIVAGDVFDFLKQKKWNSAVLFHTRTLCLLPPSFITNLYAASRDAGFEYIVGMEQIGISRDTYNQYVFSDSDQPSAIFRDGMFIHNYPGLLKKSGYEIQNIELLKTRHPDADLRILSFIAKKSK